MPESWMLRSEKPASLGARTNEGPVDQGYIKKAGQNTDKWNHDTI